MNGQDTQKRNRKVEPRKHLGSRKPRFTVHDRFAKHPLSSGYCGGDNSDNEKNELNDVDFPVFIISHLAIDPYAINFFQLKPHEFPDLLPSLYYLHYRHKKSFFQEPYQNHSAHTENRNGLVSDP